MNNRLANTKNIFQTNTKRVLCLCSAGLLRSPTMANVLHKEYGYNTRAAGVSTEYALIPVDDALLMWADEIVCVSEDVATHVNTSPLAKDKLVVLNLPDAYEWNHPELVDSIKEQYAKHMSAKDE